MSKILVGVDVGTSGAKCIIADETGKVLASATKEYPLYTPKAGWAEQNPIDWWEGVKAKGTSHGLCFGFDGNGKLALKHIVPEANIFHAFSDFRKASDFGFNYNERLTDDNFAPFRNDFTLTGEDWAVTGCAYFTPALVVDGYKVRFADVMANNGDTEVVGQGFNGTRTRCYIGRTIDNKIGLATINVKKMNIMQGAYVLADLGWTDVYYVGGDNWQSDSFQPTIVIDGKVVSGQEGQMAKYVIAFDAK